MQATNQTLSEWRTCILARDNSTGRRKRFEVRNVVGVVDEFNHLRQRVTQEDKAPFAFACRLFLQAGRKHIVGLQQSVLLNFTIWYQRTDRM
jgi:hypothetical protein